jgi:cytochrome c
MTMKPLFFLFATSTALWFSAAHPANASAQTTGQELYEQHCSACHSMLPPPKSAPPIAGLSHFYHQAFDDREAGVRHIMDFVAKPEASKSKLRAPAISRFGLMPAVELNARDLRTVSEWLWDSYDPKFQPPDCPAK